MANPRARELRKSMTRQEVKLWLQLRALRPLGHHFRRQSPLPPYIVDFEYRQSQLIIEVDGNQHGFDDHRLRDSIRDQELERRGYRILRFSNIEVDREFDGVLETIRLALSEQKEPHPAARSQVYAGCVNLPAMRPPSPGGEG